MAVHVLSVVRLSVSRLPVFGQDPENCYMFGPIVEDVVVLEI